MRGSGFSRNCRYRPTALRGIERLEARHLLTAAALDTSFGVAGRAVTDIAGSTDEAHAVALQSDGKILVAGQAYVAGQYDFGLVRYQADGSLDTTFGAGGKVTTSLSTSDDYGFDVAVQADGKIVVVGATFTGGIRGFDMGVVRYLANGSLDTSFGGGGKLVYDAGASWDDAYSVAIAADGKILVAGDSLGDSIVVRLNTDGSVDTSFDGDGKAVVSLGGGFDAASQVAVAADGKIVIAGSTDSDMGVARLNSDGSLDTTFDGDGKAVVSIGSQRDRALGLALQSDGSIVVAGWTQRAITSYDLAIVRFTASGSLDTSFNGVGIVTTQVGAMGDSSLGVAIDAAGRIVVAGRSGQDALVAWYDSNGVQQAALTDRGANGLPVMSADVAINAAGKVIVAGSVGGGAGTNFGLMQITVDNAGAGELDLSTGSLTVSGSTLIVHGTGNNDTMTLVFMSANQFWFAVNNQMQVFNTSSINSIMIDGHAGTDFINVVLPTGAFTVVTGTTALQIIGNSFNVSAVNLENSMIFGDGDDSAYLFDSSANDVLYALVHSASMSGGGSVDQVIGFSHVYAYSLQGGIDTAVMYDSTNNDTFYGLDGSSAMVGNDFVNQTVGFQQVYAQATGGTDTAVIDGTSGFDAFYGLSYTGAMLSADQLVQATQFDAVYAYAGANDAAVLYDSAGDDTFYGQAATSIITGQGFLNQATGFGATTAVGSGGGRDQAFIYDTAGNGQLTATGSFAGLTTSQGQLSIYDFAHVQVTGSSNHTSNKSVQAIDYALELSGNWNS